MKVLSLYNDLKKQKNTLIMKLKLRDFKKKHMQNSSCKVKKHKTL